ncbi:MAG: hypothetical protein J2O46_10310 [Nocardioides sp.]|nr:hypothetical protein [Nocardioides sp.]
MYAMIRGRQAAEVFTADGLRDRAQALGLGARIFVEELAQGRAEKEAEVREWIEASTSGPKQIGTGPSAQRTLGIDSPRQDMEGSTH